MSSHGDDFAVTPIQLATLVSSMANGGKLLVPRIPKTADDNKAKVRWVRSISKPIRGNEWFREWLARSTTDRVSVLTIHYRRLPAKPVPAKKMATGWASLLPMRHS